MKKQRGFDLIDLIIFVLCLVLLALLVFRGVKNTVNEVSNVESIKESPRVVCIGGYEYRFQDDSKLMKIFDEFGRTLPCGVKF